MNKELLRDKNGKFLPKEIERQVFCQWCKSPIKRRVNKDGTLERLNEYAKRRYCDRWCFVRDKEL